MRTILHPRKGKIKVLNSSEVMRNRSRALFKDITEKFTGPGRGTKYTCP